MADWTPTKEQSKIAEANRAYYSRTAGLYETTETCVTDRRAQAMLDEDIESILAIHHTRAERLTALDACAGSGNVALRLLARGVDLIVCDISPDLLAILKRKAASTGYSPEIVCTEIAEFLSGDKRAYDLIVFSSALHHLPDVGGVLDLAVSRLNAGGLIYTVFDPTPRAQLSRAARLLVRADYFAFKLLRQTSDVPSALLRRWRRGRASLPRQLSGAFDKSSLSLANENLGVLAEYHVERGIDDQDLVRQLNRRGMEVVWHVRYSDARYGLTRALLTRMGQPTAFKLLMQKPLHSEAR